MALAWIVSLGLLAGAQVQQAPEELLRNPGFNEDADGDGLPDHWNTSHDSIRWREKVFMGQDYELISQPDVYVLATQDIALEKGRQYTITVTCKAEGGGLAGALIVHGEEKPTREMPLLWNIHPTEQYEKYVRTFTAPNPVAQLYIYNIARTKGTVYYDHISLREGEPDYLIISPLSFKPIDRPLDPPLQTRHIDWGSPLAGGPVKTFLTIRTFRCLRQVIELAQRIDLDYDVVHTGYSGDECVSETARRAMKRVQGDYYEAYVVPSRISEVMAETIRERVARGAGLVVIEGFGQAALLGKGLLKPEELEEVDDAHYLRAGVPWGEMPEQILSSVQVGSLGQGRVARLVFPLDVSRVWGLIPAENSREAYRSRQFEYWEWWESLFARAILWAAKREGQARLSQEEAAPGALAIRAENAPEEAKARVALRSGREIRFDGPPLREEPREVALGDGGRLQIAVSEELPAGLAIADVTLLDGEGQALTWASFTTTSPQAVRIAGLAADKEWYDPGDEVQLGVTLETDRAIEATLEGRLIDAFGRVVSAARVTQPLTAGETELDLTLPVHMPLCVHHKAFVRALVNGREQDSDWVAVLVPEVGPGRAAEDFVATPWSPGMSHPAILAAYAERVRELGLNAEFATDPYLMGEHGMLAGGYMGAGAIFRESNWSASGVRSNCLSDPAVIEQYTDRAREAAADHRPHGLYAVGIADEAFLTSRHKRHEVCFSDHCQTRYREWLKGKYETIDALNEQWDTTYAGWDEITGARTEDVRGNSNSSPFVDFRTFMTDVWVDACRTISDAYHEVAPQTPTGHTNTFGASPFNGNDYWKLCTQAGFTWGQEYSEAIKGSGHKAIFDLWRSFVETPQGQAARTPAGAELAPFFNYGWIGYDHRAAAAHYEPWWLALHGSRGVSYFATNAVDAARGISWSLVYSTLSFTEYSMAVKEALADLRGGCGKVLMEYERERPQVALLWSHPSMLVAWCESTADEPVPTERPGTDSYGAYFRSALNVRQHLNELQLDYVYLAPEQLADRELLRQHEIVVLPFTIAASETTVEALEAYVQDGGMLVGDLRCLRTDEHGKPVAGPGHLRRLFGVERAEGGVEYGPTKVTFTGEAHGIGLDGREVELHGRESVAAAGARALAAHATGEPAVLVRELGEGLTVYLNFHLPEYDVVTHELVRQIVERAGIERRVIAEGGDADAPPRCYERNTFRRGPIAVHAFIRDHRRCSDTDPVRFAFGQEAHVYDMRAKEYLGEVDAVEATVAPGDTALYACLPYRVTGVTVSADPPSVEPATPLALHVGISGDGGEVGDHVVHVELIGPGREPVWHYTQNALAPRGVLDLVIPLALNEQPGQWRARATDVLTGTVGEAPFTVEPGR